MLSLPPLQPALSLSLSRARAADEPFQIDGFFRRFPPSPLPAVRPLAPLHLLHGVWSPAPSAPVPRHDPHVQPDSHSKMLTAIKEQTFVTHKVLPVSVEMLIEVSESCYSAKSKLALSLS